MTKKQKPVMQVNKKKLIPLIIGLLVGITLGIIFLLPMASAELITFDNVKSYDSETKTITITQFFGLGADIAELKLITPHDNEVGAGYGKVAEFKIELFSDYTDAFGDMEFFDLRNDWNKIDKDFDYKYLVKENVDVPDYETYCETLSSGNGTSYENCETIQVGTHKELQENWYAWEGEEFYEGELIIGIFTFVEVGDRVEWIPTLFGVEIDEWASWTASLNVNLVSYYKLDGTPDPVIDSLNSNNGTNSGATSGATGKIATAYSFDGSDFVNLDNLEAELHSTTIGTINWWVRVTDITPTGTEVMVSFSDASANEQMRFAVGSDGKLAVVVRTAAEVKWILGTTDTALVANEFVMLSIVQDGVEPVLYVNGTEVAQSFSVSTAKSVWLSGLAGNDNGRLGEQFANGGGTRFAFNGILDEVGFWNRTLSQAEITQLYNNGNGITQTTNFVPGVTLNSPIDNFNTTDPTINFNGTVDTQIPDNVTLFINDVGNETNSTGILGDYLFTKIIVEGVHTWNYQACTSDGCANGTARTFTIDTKPTVALQNPANFGNQTTSTVTLNGNATTPNTDLSNVTLFINDVGNETNSSGTEGNYTFIKIIADGTFNWSIQGCNLGGCVNSSERNYTIDSTAPVIYMASPNETFSFLENGSTLYFSGFANDTTLDACIREYNGINNTFACTTATLFNETFTQFNSENLNSVLYLNDTFGNTASSNISWGFKLYKESETFTASILEGSSSTFTLGIITNGSDITLANLSYDSMPNIGSISQNVNNFTITKTIRAPLVDSDTNKTFFWKVTQDGGVTSLAEQKQLVLNFGVDDCSVNTVNLYNFTIKEETNQNPMANQTTFNTQGKVDLQIKGFGLSTLINQFNSTYNQTNPFRVCINNSLSSGEKYNVDVLVEYTADNFQIEFYNIQNETIDSSTLFQNISLFDLNSSIAQAFKLVIKDSSFLPLEDAIVEIHRKYIEEGVFKIVEIPKTDANGETIGNLVVDDVIYKFVIKKFGTIIGTFSNVRAVCQTPVITTCTIDFNAFSSGIVVPDFETLTDLNFTIDFNETSRVVTSQFNIPSGEAAVMFLNVTIEDALGTKVCTDTLTSNAGTLSCVVPSNFGNATVSVKLFRDNIFQASGQVKMDQSPSDIYGGLQITLAILVLLSLVGAGMSGNPIFTIISLMVGIIALFGMNLVSSATGFVAGATILFILVGIILVIIKGSNRS